MQQVTELNFSFKARDAKSLRGKYDMIKKEVRKHAANVRKDIFRTGGGPQPVRKSLHPLEDELLAVISLSVKGLPSEFDSDAVNCK